MLDSSGEYTDLMEDALSPDPVQSAAPEGMRAPSSSRDWFEVLYLELRRRASGELFRHQAMTLGATTLLHEAWLAMDGRPLEFATQGELVSYAGKIMRGIVIDHLRHKGAVRHGGEVDFVPYDTQADLRVMADGEVLRLDDSLRDLAAADPRLAELVELHFFAGLTFAEIAALRGISVRTIMREWDKARMLLFSALRR